MTTTKTTSDHPSRLGLLAMLAATLLLAVGSAMGDETSFAPASPLASNPLAYPVARDYAVLPATLQNLQSRRYQSPTSPVGPGVSPSFEELVAPTYETPLYSAPSYEALSPAHRPVIWSRSATS